MDKRIYINADDPEEIRIAMTVDGRLEEIYIERASAETYLGNIYKGVVTNIEPSIGAAFVDFGGDRNAPLRNRISKVRSQVWPLRSISIGSNKGSAPRMYSWMRWPIS